MPGRAHWPWIAVLGPSTTALPTAPAATRSRMVSSPTSVLPAPGRQRHPGPGPAGRPGAGQRGERLLLVDPQLERHRRPAVGAASAVIPRTPGPRRACETRMVRSRSLTIVLGGAGRVAEDRRDRGPLPDVVRQLVAALAPHQRDRVADPADRPPAARSARRRRPRRGARPRARRSSASRVREVRRPGHLGRRAASAAAARSTRCRPARPGRA